MRIYETPVGEEISLEISVKDRTQPYVFKCTVKDVSPKAKCVLVDPIMYEDKLLRFNSKGVIVHAVLTSGEKPVIWRGCTVQYIAYQGQKYHAIISREESVTYNRRGSFRLPIDEYCSVKAGLNSFEAIVKDISSSGFGFSVPKFLGKTMSIVELVYHDSIMNRDMKLKGRVVRFQEGESGRTIYGCTMTPRSDVDSYIAGRQRKTMKGK